MLDQIWSQVTFVDVFNACVFLMFSLCYAYQLFYVLVVLLRKPPQHIAEKNHKYAVLISARNEIVTIGQLIQSIRSQNYPQELIDIFVVADNCTDNTAEVALQAGATRVYERHNLEQIGKGYALEFLIEHLWEDYPEDAHEAYFVFDADNVLDKNYFREMNNVFDGGAVASTSYRNSKNYNSNWISAGYATWFLREAKFLSQARLTLNTSCAISGTGFFIASHVIRECGGWKWHLLTEDIQFSAESIVQGRRISYCPTAVLYDEQPTTFRDAWNQRFRWAKGFYQVFWNYGGKLFTHMFTNPRGAKFACYDMLMTVSPAMLLTIITIAFNAIIVIMGVMGLLSIGNAIASSASSIFFCLFNYMLFMFMFGVLTTYMEWDNIRGTKGEKIKYLFTFPFFMITYIPIALVALVKRAEWKPIKHTVTVDMDDFSTAAGTKQTIEKE